jgi:hypothetical protein
MNLLKDKHYISIPIQEFERMEEVINNKKDINVNISLSMYQSGHRSFFTNTFYVHSLKHELNDNLDWNNIIKTEELIKASCQKVMVEKNKELEQINDKLSEIKSKWWYKLFK